MALLVREGLCERLCVFEDIGIVVDDIGEFSRLLDVLEELRIFLREPEDLVPDLFLIVFDRFDRAVLEWLIAPDARFPMSRCLLSHRGHSTGPIGSGSSSSTSRPWSRA